MDGGNVSHAHEGSAFFSSDLLNLFSGRKNAKQMKFNFQDFSFSVLQHLTSALQDTIFFISFAFLSQKQRFKKIEEKSQNLYI